MHKTHDFISKYLSPYLLQCQRFNPLTESKEVTWVPPTGEEVEELVKFLSTNDTDFAIIGSVAVARYLELTEQDIRHQIFRPTYTLDVLIINRLPNLPKNWLLDTNENSLITWISPGGGRVQFYMLQDVLPQNFDNIGKDVESETAGCPIADRPTLFKIKLNTHYTNDSLELITLIRKFGYPENIENQLWNETQRKNLTMIKMWTKLRLGFDK